MSAKPISNYLAAGLLFLAAAIVATGWYLEPKRIVFWTVAMLLIACMAIILFLISRHSTDDANGLRRGIVFAGLLFVIPLGLKLATTFSPAAHSGVSQRAMMIILGAFLVATGNILPKTLTPLSVLRCDPARAQAFQRFAGWTWVLAGLAVAIAWLLLPLHIADSATFVVLPGAILIIAMQLARLRWSRPGAATGNGSV